MANTYLFKTFGSDNTNQTWTFSAWLKISNVLSTSQNEIFSRRIDSNNQFRFSLYQGKLYVLDQQSNVNNIYLMSNALRRDCNGWYHVVLKMDTTQATSSDRVKIYVNGSLQTSYSTETYPSQNYNTLVNANVEHRIGEWNSTYYDGSMSHIHFIDGTAYDATAFGEYDVNGVWTINTSPSVTYGTNGFFILKNGNSVTDQSGNGNNFTVGGGTLTNTEDCPSNVFATLNPLYRMDLVNNATLSNGNNTFSSDQAGYNIRYGTLGANKGKFYYEAKFISQNNHGNSDSLGMPFGISGSQIPSGVQGGGYAQYDYSYNYDGSNGTVQVNNTSSNYGTTILNAVGQIGMCAFDLDNNKLYFGVNGVWTNSANPSSGTGGYTIADVSTTELGFYFPSTADRSILRSYVYSFNFGNGYFGTTAVASAGTNASGIGIFEYDVPTGYTALSTKGLNL